MGELLSNGLTQEQAARAVARFEAEPIANAIPAPGPLLDAMLPETLRALGFQLREPVASDWMILQKIGSPMVQEMVEAQKADDQQTKVFYDAAQVWELVYLWTRPVQQVRKALENGVQEFRETVMREVGDVLPLSVLMCQDEVMASIAALVQRSFVTKVLYGSAEKDKQVFTKPPPGPATASGGGSTPSAQ